VAKEQRLIVWALRSRHIVIICLNCIFKNVLTYLPVLRNL